MEEMRMIEVDIICSGLNLCVKNDLLQTRQLYYVIAQGYSQKKLDPKRIFPLPYDNGGKGTKLTKKDADKLKKFMNFMNKKGQTQE